MVQVLQAMGAQGVTSEQVTQLMGRFDDDKDGVLQYGDVICQVGAVPVFTTDAARHHLSPLLINAPTPR